MEHKYVIIPKSVFNDDIFLALSTEQQRIVFEFFVQNQWCGIVKVGFRHWGFRCGMTEPSFKSSFLAMVNQYRDIFFFDEDTNEFTIRKYPSILNKDVKIDSRSAKAIESALSDVVSVPLLRAVIGSNPTSITRAYDRRMRQILMEKININRALSSTPIIDGEGPDMTPDDEREPNVTEVQKQGSHEPECEDIVIYGELHNSLITNESSPIRDKGKGIIGKGQGQAVPSHSNHEGGEASLNAENVIEKGVESPRRACVVMTHNPTPAENTVLGTEVSPYDVFADEMRRVVLPKVRKEMAAAALAADVGIEDFTESFLQSLFRYEKFTVDTSPRSINGLKKLIGRHQDYAEAAPVLIKPDHSAYNPEPVFEYCVRNWKRWYPDKEPIPYGRHGSAEFRDRQLRAIKKLMIDGHTELIRVAVIAFMWPFHNRDFDYDFEYFRPVRVVELVRANMFLYKKLIPALQKTGDYEAVLNRYL